MNELSVLVAPAVAGLLVLLTHVRLGEQVLRRGIVFVDLAIAQIAALGVLMAATVTDSPALSSLAGSLAALVGATLVAWLERCLPSRREALIGLVYVAGAVSALLWVSADPRGSQKLAAMLSGDVLWTTWPRLLPLAIATVPFLLADAWKPDLWTRSSIFYPSFAILVSLSVPLLGLYLVFATLIVPALAMPVPAAARRRDRHAAVAFGGLAYAAGLLASLRWDLPSGPCIVLALMCAGAAAAGSTWARKRPDAGD